MNRTLLIPIVIAALISVGCQRKELSSPAQTGNHPWQKATKFESALFEPGVPIEFRYSNCWEFDPQKMHANIASVWGAVVLTSRGGKREVTRGIVIRITQVDQKNTDSGERYLDLDELPSLVQTLRAFSRIEKPLPKETDGIAGAQFYTRGGLAISGGQGVGHQVIVCAFDKQRLGEGFWAVWGKRPSDVEELISKLELAREWAEKQTP